MFKRILAVSAVAGGAAALSLRAGTPPRKEDGSGCCCSNKSQSAHGGGIYSNGGTINIGNWGPNGANGPVNVNGLLVSPAFGTDSLSTGTDKDGNRIINGERAIKVNGEWVLASTTASQPASLKNRGIGGWLGNRLNELFRLKK